MACIQYLFYRLFQKLSKSGHQYENEASSTCSTACSQFQGSTRLENILNNLIHFRDRKLVAEEILEIDSTV